MSSVMIDGLFGGYRRASSAGDGGDIDKRFGRECVARNSVGCKSQ